MLKLWISKSRKIIKIIHSRDDQVIINSVISNYLKEFVHLSQARVTSELDLDFKYLNIPHKVVFCLMISKSGISKNLWWPRPLTYFKNKYGSLHCNKQSVYLHGHE